MCHSGVVDGYWEYRLKPWDMAAGALIVQEAGGRLTTTDGAPFTVFARSVLATNQGLYNQVRMIFFKTLLEHVPASPPSLGTYIMEPSYVKVWMARTSSGALLAPTTEHVITLRFCFLRASSGLCT